MRQLRYNSSGAIFLSAFLALDRNSPEVEKVRKSVPQYRHKQKFFDFFVGATKFERKKARRNLSSGLFLYLSTKTRSKLHLVFKNLESRGKILQKGDFS